MPLTIKLTGTPFEIRSGYCGNVDLSNLIKIFVDKDMTVDEIRTMKFIHNYEQMNEQTSVLVLPNADEQFHVFSDIPDVKHKLCLIFISLQNSSNRQSQGNTNQSNGYYMKPDEQITTPVVDEEPAVVITMENIKATNLKTIELFQNKDFKSLVSIYYSNPSIIKTFMSFITNGNIVELPFSENIEQQDENEEKKHIQYFRELGITTENENIVKALHMFKGHLNLTLRYLLCNY